MLDVIVGDCEVFKNYFLFVAYELPSTEPVVIETQQQLMEFYNRHRNGVWCFYNSSYDKYIIQAVLAGLNPKELNDYIIKYNKQGWTFSPLLSNYPLNAYNVKTTDNGLKVLEAYMGADIRETTVPFDLDRPLTEEEREQVIFYCKHDVAQTFEVLKLIKPDFKAHYDLCKAYNKPLNLMDKPIGSLTVNILGTRKFTPTNVFDVTISDNLRLDKYRNVLEWYKDILESGRDGNDVYGCSLTTEVAGTQCTFGWGGVHSAISKLHLKGHIVAVDVASLYPSLMVNYNFYSRAMINPERYYDMYVKRLQYKAEHHPLNTPFKLALNSSYGKYKDKTSPMYDPLPANNITINGQLFLLDLVEKVEQQTKCRLLNLNTDGCYYEIVDESDFDKLKAIVAEWEQRTKLKMELDEYVELHQRDVNNYIMIDAQGHIKRKGELKERSPLDYDCPIIPEAIVEYLAYDTPIADTIQNCDEYIKFQKVYKLKGKYTAALHNDKVYTDIHVFRVFASKSYKDTALYKKHDKGAELFTGCPAHCFIDNGKVAGLSCPNNLNKSWYIEEASRRLDQWFDNSNSLFAGLL